MVNEIIDTNTLDQKEKIRMNITEIVVFGDGFRIWENLEF